jgi:hypothetical protein
MKNRIALLAIVSCFLLVFSSIGGATPVLTLSTGSTTIVITDLTPGDMDGRPDYVAFSGAIGGWNIVDINLGSNLGALTVTGNVLGGNDTPLQILVSDDDFINGSGSVTFAASINGTEPYRETINASYYWGTGLFEESKPVYYFASPNPAFSGYQETGFSSVPDAYSMTQVITLGHWVPDNGNAYMFQSTLNNAPIPEPSSMILLGSGLLGAALFFRLFFKKNKK